MNERVKEIFINCFGYVMVGLTCVTYILTTAFVLNPTGKTIWGIIGDGVIVFLLGVSINNFLRAQGLINGKKSKDFIDTYEVYGVTVAKISPYINFLEEWCNEKNKKTYEGERAKILSSGGLKYIDCFDEFGVVKPYMTKYNEKIIEKNKKQLRDKAAKKAEKIRIKLLKKENKQIRKEEKNKRRKYWKAINLQLFELHPSDLTSEGGKRGNPNYLGCTIKEYETYSLVKDIASKVFMAMFFGIYGIALVEDFNLINLLWSAFQVFTFLFTGFISMKASEMFICNEYRSRIIKKIDNLEEFYAVITANAQTVNMEGDN